MEPAGSTGDVVVGARAGSGQSQSSRTASWDPSGLDQPADRVSDGLTKRRGLYAEFGSGDRVVEPRVPAKQLNAFAVTWVVPPFGQPTLDGVDEAGRGTDHRPGQDQVGEPSPGDVREGGEHLVPVDVMSRHDVPAGSPPCGEHGGDHRRNVADVDDMHPSARPEREAAEQDPAQPFALVATVRIARTPDTARVDRHNRRAGLL